MCLCCLYFTHQVNLYDQFYRFILVILFPHGMYYQTSTQNKFNVHFDFNLVFPSKTEGQDFLDRTENGGDAPRDTMAEVIFYYFQNQTTPLIQCDVIYNLY